MTSDNVYKLIEDNGLTLHGDIEHFAALIKQRTWVGLTDEERVEIRMYSIENMGENFQETLCKAIEAKLKEKNT